MDKLLSAMVAACRDDGLDLICRVHMLEIIELRLEDLRRSSFCHNAFGVICFYLAHVSRSMGWQTNENVTNYYKQKLAQIDAPPSRPQVIKANMYSQLWYNVVQCCKPIGYPDKSSSSHWLPIA